MGYLYQLLAVYSQREIAVLLGTSQARVSLWKHGKSKISKKYLRALMKAAAEVQL